MGRCTPGDVDRAGALHEQGLALRRAQGEHGNGNRLSDLALLARRFNNAIEKARAHAARRSALGRQLRLIAGRPPGRSGSWPARTQPRDTGHDAARLRGAMEGLVEGIGSFRAADGHVVDRRPPVRGRCYRKLGTEVDTQALASGRRCRSGRQSTAFGSKA